MSETEDKLARKLGFRVDEHGRVHYLDGYARDCWPSNAVALWRKCLELTEQCPCGCGQVRYELAPTPHAHTADNCVCKHCQKTELTDKLEQAMLDAELTEQRERGTKGSGVCYCGQSMEGHPVWDNHVATEMPLPNTEQRGVTSASSVHDFAVKWEQTHGDVSGLPYSFAEAYASSRLAAQLADVQNHATVYYDQWKTEYEANATLRAELGRLQKLIEEVKQEITEEPTIGRTVDLLFREPLEKAEAENRELTATVARLTGERDAAVSQLAECYRLSGADPDGNEDWRLAPRAVEEVRRLRKEYDEEEDKLLNAYFQDQTIAPDGKLRPTFAKLINRAETSETALSKAQQALRRQAIRTCMFWVRDKSVTEANYGRMQFLEQDVARTIEKWLAEAALPSDTQGAQAQENELCAACHHVKNDSTMHFDAKGTNWGAALHWFQGKEK
jgi:hypothetical protein